MFLLHSHLPVDMCQISAFCSFSFIFLSPSPFRKSSSAFLPFHVPSISLIPLLCPSKACPQWSSEQQHEVSTLPSWFITFMLAVMEYFEQSNLRKKGVIRAYSSREVESILVEKVCMAAEAGSWWIIFPFTHRKRKRDQEMD